MRHVYIAADANGRHKIGVTSNPLKRCRELSRDLDGVAVSMVHLEPHALESFEIEGRAHAMLEDHHEGGEWFAVDRETAVSAVRLAVLSLRTRGPHSPTPAMTASQIPRAKGAGGRKRMLTDGKLVALKADAALWDRVDAWAARQTPPITNRSAAIRAMIERVLAEDQADSDAS